MDYLFTAICSTFNFVHDITTYFCYIIVFGTVIFNIETTISTFNYYRNNLINKANEMYNKLMILSQIIEVKFKQEVDKNNDQIEFYDTYAIIKFSYMGQINKVYLPVNKELFTNATYVRYPDESILLDQPSFLKIVVTPEDMKAIEFYGDDE